MNSLAFLGGWVSTVHVIMIIVLAVLVVAAVREYWLFRFLPARADKMRSRGDRETARLLLEKVAGSPALFAVWPRAMVHYRLAWAYLEQRRPQDALAEARRSVAIALPPALESICRTRLADCLEACGDVQAADEERERAKRLAESRSDTAAQLMARGKTLRKEGRFAESIPIYERAISLSQGMAVSVRTHLMVSLALSCWEAGRINEALRTADQALGLQPDPSHRTSALSVSALALGNLGRLDEAEDRWAQALTAATESGNRALAARYIALLAEVQRRRGKLAEALETCDRAATIGKESRRTACYVAFETLLTWGRLEEARAKLEDGASAAGFTVPRSEKRMQATTELNRGLLAAESGELEEALARLDSVENTLARDEKIATTYHAIRAWILAALGRRSESEDSARAAAAFASRTSDDRALLLRYHTYLGRAAVELGDAAAGREHFEACMNLAPDPAEVPRAHYFLGECCRILGDHAGATARWRAAVDTGLDTRFVQLARVRLAE